MEKVKLTKICNPKQWKTIPTSELKVNGYPVYGANGIIGYYSEYNHENETVAITCRGATCGSINITKPMSYITGNAMCIDELREDIMVKYLYYCLKNYNFNKVISGSAQPQITRQNLEKVYLNIGTIEEQQEIVEILDMVSSIIEKRKVQLEGLDNLIKSRFVEMFGKEKYRMVKSKDVCGFITKGTTPKTNEIVDDYTESFVPYLKVYNLSFDGQMLFDVKPQFIGPEIHMGGLARSKVYPNDVLMNIVGPPLGKFALVPETYKEWNINQAIAIFRATDKVIPRFLLHALMQPKVLQPFIDSAVGIRQQNLSLEQCRNLEIPLPPLDIQNQFATFVQQVDKLKFEVQKSLNETQLLFDSLMQKYFE